MRFQRTQKALTFFLALVGALPLIASTEIGWGFSATFFLLWGAGWLLPYDLMRSEGYRRGITGALVVLMSVQIARMFFGVPMAQVGMEFIAAALGAKLTSRGFASDYYQIVILSFLHIIAATVAIDDLLYGVCFILFVGLSSPVLALTYLRQEMENRFKPNTGNSGAEVLERLFMSKRIISGGFLATTSLLSIPVLIMTALLFVFFPRLGIGVFGKLKSHEAAVGFGETVTLGDLDIVRMEDTVVIRLEPVGDEPPQRTLPLRIRGAVFDIFDNNKWSRSRNSGGWSALSTNQQRYLIDPEAARKRGRRFDVLLEPLDPKVLFVPEGTGVIHTNLVSQKKSVAPRALEGNRLGEIRYTDDAEVGIRYRVELTDSPPTGAPPSPAISYLGLTEGGERIARLADELAPEGTGRGVTHQLITGLRSRYQYSLSLAGDARNATESTPLDRFLFSRRTGTCEHFATALTLMLRAKGIPARLVTGFHGADWNSVGEFYSVRKRSAHSWTEAYLDGRWVTLDATPSVSGAEGLRPPGKLSMIIDALRMRWHKHIVGYDLSTQGKIAISIWRFWRRNSRFGKGLPGIPKAIPILILVLAAAGIAWHRFRRRSPRSTSAGKKRPPRMAQKEATRLLNRLERRLAKLGYPRTVFTTPLEYTEIIEQVAPDLAAGARPVIDRYNQVRFGQVAFRPGEYKRLTEEIRQLGRSG